MDVIIGRAEAKPKRAELAVAANISFSPLLIRLPLAAPPSLPPADPLADSTVRLSSTTPVCIAEQ